MTFNRSPSRGIHRRGKKLT